MGHDQSCSLVELLFQNDVEWFGRKSDIFIKLPKWANKRGRAVIMIKKNPIGNFGSVPSKMDWGEEYQ